MSTKTFNFVEAYRAIDSGATREIVTAREEAFKIIRPQTDSIGAIHDLCRLAFHLPYAPESYLPWFATPISDADHHFVIAQDSADAGRMATVILRDHVLSGSSPAALSVLATSFAGRRSAFDKGELVEEARDLISESAKRRGLDTSPEKLSYPTTGSYAEELVALDQGVTPENVKELIDTVREDETAALSLIDAAYRMLRSDTVRLAEEVDMLWFHIGDWSNTLDVPRSSIPIKLLPTVAGIDLGGMVRDLPGPYGAYGIIRKTLGKNSDDFVTIPESFANLEISQISKLACESAPEIFPVHAALKLAARGGDWLTALKATCPDVGELKLSQAELATQAYRERVSLVYAGLHR
jgi:hypothetical protein